MTRAIAKLIEREGFGLDVVSMGELYTALSADFPAERIEMNGNAKSQEEIEYAVRSGVGRIIVDHTDELKVIESCAKKIEHVILILLRVTPGVDAHTHSYIATGQTGSKFGFPLEGSMLTDAITYAMNSKFIDLRGLHFHVGSQIFDTQDYLKSLHKVLELMKDLKAKLNFTTHELNFGGGFGAVTNPATPHMSAEFYTDALMKALHEECVNFGLEVPRAIIEPGRWIVSEACITLYRVENIKELPGITYIAVNGGMADNPRVALYNAEYEAVAVANPDAKISNGNTKVSIVGKCCESGDVLIEDARIPKLQPGDIIGLYNSGAYTFSMASNYNCLQRPAVVFVENGEAKLAVERQSLEDLIRGQKIL